MPDQAPTGSGEHNSPLPLNARSQANETSRFVSSGLSRVYGFSGYNAGVAGYVQLLDLQTPTVPANGTVPDYVLQVAAAAGFFADWGFHGRVFRRGVWIAYSSTEATLTLGTASCFFDVQYVNY